MDTKLKYQEIIKNILTETAEYRASIPDGYNSQVLFDDEHGRYLVLDIGWSDDQYLHTTPIHIDLIDHKIWIQYDDTEEGIANDFIAAGVPTHDIVLGFRHPKSDHIQTLLLVNSSFFYQQIHEIDKTIPRILFKPSISRHSLP